MKRMKVLFVSHSAELYGAERFLLEIISRLDQNAFEVFLLCPKKGILTELAAQLNITIFIIPYKYWLARKSISLRHACYLPLNIISVFKIMRLIDRYDFDLVFTNCSVVFSAAVASKLKGKPHVWHIHETLGKQPDAFRLLYFYNAVPRIMNFLSEKMIFDSLAIRYLFWQPHSSKHCVVYNGFELNNFVREENDKELIRIKYDIPAEAKVITVVGSMSERKGQHNVALALPTLLRVFPDMKLVLSGLNPEPNEYEKGLHRIIDENGLKDQVVLVNYKDDVSDIYKLSDLLIVPSRDEPFGRVIVEAMLYHTPVLATRVGGIPEIIEHDVNGVLLDSREPESIAKAVIELFQAPGRLNRLASEGLQSARGRFDMTVTISQIENILTTTSWSEGGAP